MVPKLSDTQAVLLAAAAARPDLSVLPAPETLRLRGAALERSLNALRPPGLLTQAPPNTGAGWYSLATGAWPAVTGSTNNTFHRSGTAFTNRTAAFDAG